MQSRLTLMHSQLHHSVDHVQSRRINKCWNMTLEFIERLSDRVWTKLEQQWRDDLLQGCVSFSLTNQITINSPPIQSRCMAQCWMNHHNNPVLKQYRQWERPGCRINNHRAVIQNHTPPQTGACMQHDEMHDSGGSHLWHTPSSHSVTQKVPSEAICSKL